LPKDTKNEKEELERQRPIRELGVLAATKRRKKKVASKTTGNVRPNSD
jgi:hypothetical protein